MREYEHPSSYATVVPRESRRSLGAAKFVQPGLPCCTVPAAGGIVIWRIARDSNMARGVSTLMKPPASDTRATTLRGTLTLLESAHAPPIRAQFWYYGSTVAQVVMVYAVVAGYTTMFSRRADPLSRRPLFLAPFHQERPRPVQGHLSYVALGGIDARQRGAGGGSVLSSTRDGVVPKRVGGGDGMTPSETHEEDASRAYSEIEVDSAAVRDPDSAGPMYPPTLMARSIEGSVLVTFVVDTTGRADPASFNATESTDSLFSNAVRDALPGMRFSPAKRGSTVVRQVVQQRFTFRMPKPAVPQPPHAVTNVPTDANSYIRFHITQ